MKRWAPRLASFVSLLVLVFLATGCAEQPDAAQPRSTKPVGEIIHTRTVGQTFVATAGNLSRIDLLMASYARHNHGPVIFCLKESPDSDVDLVKIEIEAADVKDNEWQTFRFEPIRDSAGHSFYFFLKAPKATPGNAVTIWQSAQDVYPDGQSVIDGRPGDSDLAFRAYTAFTLRTIAVDVWWGMRHRGWILVLSGALFVLPGYVLSTGLLRRREFSFFQRLILGCGLSVALLPLIMYLAYPLSLRLGTWAAWGLVVLSGGGVLWHHRSALRGWRFQTVCHWRPGLASVGLTIVLGLTLAVRLLAVRDLVAPMWGDSYQHTMVVQLMVDHGGLFQSWEPYAPLTSFTYHFGFQATTAFFHWLTGTEVIHSVIWVGQILNVLAAVTLYPLAVKMARGNRWAGVLAVLIAGLLSKMPMYYVNWGRYTQLAGQVILPIAMWLTWEALDRKERSWGLLITAVVSVAGLSLTHYRVLLMYLAFVLPLGMMQLWIRWQDKPGEIVLRLGVVGGASLLIFLPWSYHSLMGYLPRWLGYHIVPTAAWADFTQQYNSVGPISYFTSLRLLALGSLGGAWGLLKKQRGVFLILLWVGVVLLMANPGCIGLTGTGIINNYAVLIAIYIPLALLGGWLGGQLVKVVQGRWGWGWDWIVLVGLMGLSLWGGSYRLIAVEASKHALLGRQDMAAMQWIEANTSTDAKFLINSFLAFGDTSPVGSDGGWWLPLLAGRANTVPPLTYGLERASDPDYPVKVAEFARQVQGADLDDPQVRTLLREQGITHVYIGEQGGHVNYDGDDVLDANVLSESPYYRMVYHQGKVWIFELLDGK